MKASLINQIFATTQYVDATLESHSATLENVRPFVLVVGCKCCVGEHLPALASPPSQPIQLMQLYSTLPLNLTSSDIIICTQHLKQQKHGFKTNNQTVIEVKNTKKMLI